MSRLLKNVTIREMLLLTFVAALSVQYFLHRSRIRKFAENYSRLQDSIAEYEEQTKALQNFQVTISEGSDVLETVERHNSRHPQVACGIYFQPSSHRWYANLVDEIPKMQGFYDSRGSGQSPAEAVRRAEPHLERDTPNRVFDRVRKLVGQPCSVDYDEKTNQLRIAVALRTNLDEHALKGFQKISGTAD